MSEAYLAAPERKAAVLARLEEALAAGRVLFDTGIWNAPKGSPAAVVAQDADLRSFEAFTGFPAAIGGLVDLVALYLSNAPEQRDTFLMRFFSAVRPGAALDRAAAQILVAMHDDPAMTAAAGDDAEAAALLARSRAAHGDAAAGQDVPRAVWSALRGDAMQLAEQRTGPVMGALDFIERTAWPLARSRSVLSEGLGIVIGLVASLAVRQSGWTAADQRKVDDTLHAIEAEAMARGEAQPNYPAILSAREPALEARFREQIELQSRCYAATTQVWADRLVALMEHF
ncbi:hypothetical protein [Novosphingobium olei]|uniref:Uncharacterized protein n=1 Tax=Novosphingobium olei TaxID=2728851 RepID=A0A7Y0BPG8_9SPHN|nr:hypothetical protein [Novosphingobium olei]NML93973.1 hypothetical protein [Novosphingobium olei]